MKEVLLSEAKEAITGNHKWTQSRNQQILGRQPRQVQLNKFLNIKEEMGKSVGARIPRRQL